MAAVCVRITFVFPDMHIDILMLCSAYVCTYVKTYVLSGCIILVCPHVHKLPHVEHMLCRRTACICIAFSDVRALHMYYPMSCTRAHDVNFVFLCLPESCALTDSTLGTLQRRH